jgi:MHS family proline/betaine transporter-like MFS transporter
VEESPSYIKAKKQGKLSKTPIREVFKHHKNTLLMAVGLYLTVTVPFYTFSAFFNNFMQFKVGFSFQDSMFMNGIAMLFSIMFMPISGYISDKIGRKKVLRYSALCIFVISFPVFKMLISGNFVCALLGQIIFGIVLGFYMGPVPATLVELFPTSIRFTGLSLSYNISAALFGGTTPYIFLKLIKYTNSNLSPAFYIMVFVLITFFIVGNYKDRHNQPLSE